MKKLVLCGVVCVAHVANAQTVKVHLEAPPSVVLEEDAYRRWVGVCTSPCDHELDIRGIYRIAGRDVQRKRIDIRPPPGKNALAIRVEPGSRATNIVGSILTPFGAGAAIVGLIFTLGGGDWVTGGSAAAIAGTVAGFVGLILLSVSQTTITFTF